MNQKKPKLKSIIKNLYIFRNIIKKYYHNIWKHNYLGVEPTEDRKAKVEIDETELICNSEKVLWLFGIIDRATKDTRVFSIMTNRRKENLIPIIEPNVYTIN